MKTKMSVSNNAWNSDVKYALGFYRMIGRIMGIWPLDNKDINFKLRIVFIIIVQVGECIDLMRRFLNNGNCGDILDMMNVLIWFTCAIMTAIKVIFLTVHQYKLYPIIISAVDDWSTTSDEKSRSIMLRYALIGRTVFIIQMTGAYVAVFTNLFIKLPFIISFWNDRFNHNITIEGVPPWPNCWVPVDLTFHHYILLFLAQCGVLFVIGTVYNGCDTFFFGIAMHLSGQFVVLQKNLEHLNEMNKSVQYTDRLKYFVKRHKHILRLASNFEDTYNLIILIHVGIAAVLICSSGITMLISLRSLDLFAITAIMSRILLTYVIIFLYSYVGEELRYSKIENPYLFVIIVRKEIKGCITLNKIFIRSGMKTCLHGIICFIRIRRSHRNYVHTMNSEESSEVAWNSDTIYALGLHKTLTRLLGIWPIENRKYFVVCQTAFGSILQLMVVIIYTIGLITKGNCGTIIDFVDAITLISVSTLSVLKFIPLHLNQRSMSFIVNSAIEDWKNIESEKLREIMLKYAQKGRIVLIVQMCGAYTTIIPLIFGNLPNPGVITNEKSVNNMTSTFRNIPIGPNCWFSSSAYANIYLAVYFLITLHLIILCTGYIGIDVYIFGIAMHVCGQFELLHYNLVNLDSDEKYYDLRAKIRKLTNRHCHLLTLANEFENALNLIILLQVAVNGFIISFSGILLIWGMQAGNTELIIGSMIRIYLLYFQLFIYSYVGEYLTTQAEKLQVAIYNCSWYKMPPSLVHDLILIMMRIHVRRSYHNYVHTMNSEESSKVAWNSDTNYALGLHRTLTRLLGVWPIERRKYLVICQTAFCSTLQIMVVAIYIIGLLSKGNCGAIIDFVDAISIISVSILSVLKFIPLHLNQRSMFLIVSSAIEDWKNIEGKKLRAIMLKYAYKGRLVFIAQMCGAYVTLIPLIFENLPNPGVITHDKSVNNMISTFRNIPIGPNCWFPSSTFGNIYLAVYFLITLHLIVFCTGYIGIDVYVFGIAMHICGQFELLYHKLMSFDGDENYHDLRKKILLITKRHCHLLMLANEFEKTLNLIILLQVAVNGFIICLSGILLIWGLQAGNTELIIASMIRIYLLYFQLFIYCYIGENLTTQAEKLQVAVYSCSWYKMPPSLVHDLTFIMMRNNYAFHLTAGKIYDMNIPNFQNLIKTMFSYFSVIRLMFE
ncbi:hypothetical protein PV327_001048 [Microctonus hyperodae]|uniref:Odorant receptor n=1 Tax=Microctonus hyperodae TaxID=165561 RepID=A0AA39G7F2_MICHY|nr:hypothetical protein PV327_001048 [Microctonus hyperodae]